MSRSHFSSLFVAFAAIIASAAAADIRFDRVGQWGGTCNAVAIRDNLAYVGIGPRLVILDVSDPQHPIRVGQSEPLGNFPVEILVDGGYAYVAAFAAGLKIVDIRDPSNPRAVGEFTPNDTTVQVAIDGDLLCVGGYNSGFWLVDVTDRTNPVPLTHVPDDDAWRGDAQFHQGKLFYAGGGKLRIYDVSTPTVPIVVGQLNGVSGWAIEIRNEVAYVARGSRLTAIDVSDPTHPVMIGNASAPDNDFTIGLQLRGSRAFTVESGTVNEFDISNPRQMAWTRALALNNAGHGIAFADDIAWIANWYDGLRAYDVAPGAGFELVAGYDDLGHVFDVKIFGDTVFALGYGLRVSWVDISDLFAPVLRAKFADDALSVDFDGRYAFVGRAGGVSIYDLHAEPVPVEIWSDDLPFYVHDVQVVGNALFAAAQHETEYGEGTVLAYDISNLAHPQRLGWYFGSAARDLLVDENLLYVLTVPENALWVYDVSDETQPQFVNYIPVRGAGVDMELVDGYLYVQNAYGIDVLDVSNPADILAGPYFRQGGAYFTAIATDGTRLFSAPGLREIVVDDPLHPHWGSHYPTMSYTSGVDFADGRVFLCTEDDGLEIIAVSRRGDLNGDDRISLEDLAGVLAAFGTCAVDPTFNRLADLDQDGCVELFDLAALLVAME